MNTNNVSVVLVTSTCADAHASQNVRTTSTLLLDASGQDGLGENLAHGRREVCLPIRLAQHPEAFAFALLRACKVVGIPGGEEDLDSRLELSCRASHLSPRHAS